MSRLKNYMIERGGAFKNYVHEHRREIGESVYGLTNTIAIGLVLTGFGFIINYAVSQSPPSSRHITATPSVTSSPLPTATLEQMVEPTSTLEPTLTATPTPVEYGEGITRVEMLVAQNINPSVIDLADYNIDSKTQFRRVLQKYRICVVPYLVEDGEIGHAIGEPGVLDGLDVLRVDIDESRIPTSYGNHIQVVYDIGHMENDECVSGIKGNPVMELSVALAHQNGNFKNSLLDGIKAIKWPEKNSIAPVHEVDLGYQHKANNLISGEARSTGYADLAFIVFEKYTPGELAQISGRLEDMFSINQDIYERILLTDADGDGLFNLLPRMRYDFVFPVQNNQFNTDIMFTDERGIVQSNLLQDPSTYLQDRRNLDAEGFLRSCDALVNIVALYSTSEIGLTTYFGFDPRIFPAKPIEQRAPIGSSEAQEYLLLSCGLPPKPTDQPRDRPTPTPGTIIIPFPTPRDP